MRGARCGTRCGPSSATLLCGEHLQQAAGQPLHICSGDGNAPGGPHAAPPADPSLQTGPVVN